MRIVKRLAHVLLIVLTLVIGATSAALIVTHTAWFKDWLRGYIVREANQFLNGQLSIERLGGNLFFGVELHDVGVAMDGGDVVAIQDLALDYNVFELIAHGLSVKDLRLNHPVLYLRRDGDSWAIGRLLKKQGPEANRQGSQTSIDFEHIAITDGSVVVDESVAGASGVSVPKQFDGIDAALSFRYEPAHYSIEIANLSFQGSNPDVALSALSGRVSVKDDTLSVQNLALQTGESSILLEGAIQHYLSEPVINMRLSSDRLSLPEVAYVVPAVAGIRLTPAFELALNGPLDRLGVGMTFRSSAGDATGSFTADVSTPGQALAGDLSIRHLNVAAIVSDPKQTSDVTADAHVDVRTESVADVDSLRGSASLKASHLLIGPYAAESLAATGQFEGRRVSLNARARAYRAEATATGRVTLPTDHQPMTFDLRGRATHLNLQKLPADFHLPPADTDVGADYHLVGSIASPPAGTRHKNGAPGLALQGDATLLESAVPGAHIQAGSTAALSLDAGTTGYRADLTADDVNLERFGEAFGVPALATSRYASRLSVHLAAEGHGTTPTDMGLTARGTLRDSSLLGAQIPELEFEANLSNNAVRVSADGAFAEFNPATAAGRSELKGSLAGTLDVDATVSNVSAGVTADNITATVRATLDRSTIGDLTFDWANVDGDYDRRAGNIRDLEVVGRDLNVEASGTLSLNDTGSSHLTFRADSLSLEHIGKLIEKPLAGTATVEGTVTGNRSHLHAEGTVVADGAKYGEDGALNLRTAYSVEVPELAFDRANVKAETNATFVTLAGQPIKELTAKATYGDTELTFDATASQPQRSLGVAGSVRLQPDHQELHVKRLALTAQGQSWELERGSSPVVQYGPDAITIEGLTLTSADQRITVQGAFGEPKDTLNVALENLNLASVDALLLRPPQFSGRLNATATISGTKTAPDMSAAFSIAQGGFRQFHYQTLEGTAGYSLDGVTLDATIHQNGTQWLTAKGHVPIAAFAPGKSAGTANEHVHREPVAMDEQIDLAIESSPIDLGVVQGFTTQLTEVQGTAEAHVHVAGVPTDPHLSGRLTIANGAATIVPTGVRYTHVAGQIELEPDRIHIDQITLLDNQQNALSVTGDLGLHQREVGSVRLYVNADDFKVLENAIGNMRVQSQLEIGGELRAPRVEGYVGLNTGRLDLDRLLGLAGTSPYSTEQTQYKDHEPKSSRPSTPFDALTMEVHVTVPDDLLVKARDLQIPGAPIGLGALDLTLGGDVRAVKDPGGALRLIGIIKTVRGTYDFQGRRFDILRDGTVQFEGFTPPNSMLNLKTRRLIKGVEAHVDVNGTLDKPEIVLSSVPPLEEADILALIVFNQPINQLGEGQQLSLAARAQALATSAVTSQLAQSIGSALHLETFKIDVAPETGSGPTLTIGQQVGQNVYVKLEQGIGDQSTTNFVLEYELLNWLRLQTNVLQGSSSQQSLFRRSEGSGADLFFLFSY